MKNLTNFILFQAGWFACVLSVAHGQPWWGPTAALVALAVHLLFVSRTDWRGEIRFVMIAGLFGIALDSTMSGLGVMSWTQPDQPAWLCPPWLLALWMVFPTSIGHSLGWMDRRPWLAASFGLVGGPLTYLAGTKLGAVYMPGTWSIFPALLAMGVAWAIFFPLLYPLRRWAHSG